MKRFLSIFLAVLLLCSMPAYVASDAVGTTIRLAETSGTVTVKDASGKTVNVRSEMRLYNGYVIETGAKSSAYINLDDAKAIKLDSSGKCELRKSGKKLEIYLLSGNLFFNVDKPLTSNESLNIRTSTMVTGVRGSFGWVNPFESCLLHGHSIVTYLGEMLGELQIESMELQSGESIRLTVQDAIPGETVPGEPGQVQGKLEKSTIRTEDIPAVAAEEIAADPEKQEQLQQDVPTLDVQEIIETAPEKRAQEEAREEEKQQEAAEAIAEQTKEIGESEPEHVPPEEFKEEQPAQTAAQKPDREPVEIAPVSPSVPSTSPEPVKPQSPANSSSLMAALQNGSATLYTNGTPTVYENVTVGAGQTLNIVGTGRVTMPNLIIEAGGMVNVSAGATLVISGTDLVIRGTLTNNGTVSSSADMVLSGTTVNNGNYLNSATLAIAPGASFTGGTVSNTGTVIANGTFSPGACDGVVIRN